MSSDAAETVCFRLGRDRPSAYELDRAGNLVLEKFDIAEYRLEGASLNVEDLESRVSSENALALDLTGTCGTKVFGGDRGICLRDDFFGGIGGKLLAGGGVGKRLYAGEGRAFCTRDCLWASRESGGFVSLGSATVSLSSSSSGIDASGKCADASETDSRSDSVVDNGLACFAGFEPKANFLKDTIIDWMGGVVGELASDKSDRGSG